MQSKFEQFNELPPELKIESAQNVLSRDLVNLAQTSKYHLALFKPMIDVRKFLHHVTRGEHDAVEVMLTQDISLMIKRDNVADCSGREFKNLSGFEYALWALDKHMWAAMIACIPQNEEGKKVFAQLIAQYNKANTIGVTYKLNEKTITEKHFDFDNTIIKELQTQMDSRNTPGTKNWEAIEKQWREGVGGAQKMLPMHVVDKYCSVDIDFCFVTKLTPSPKLSTQFYNWCTEKYDNWFSIGSKLSVDFAIYRTWTLDCGHRAFGASTARISPCGDLDAMKELCKVRTNDFIDLKSQLEDQMTLNNYHQVSKV